MTDTMIEAAVAREAHQPLSLECLALAEPAADEVLVRIAGCGICHTDLIIRDRHAPFPMPAVLGHEGAGVVERVGAGVDHVAPGDHVVLSFASCGACASCAAGRPAYCEAFYPLNFAGTRSVDAPAYRTADGGAVTGGFFGQSSFGSHALANKRSVVKVDASVPLWLLGPLGCGIQTGAGAVMNVLKAGAGDTIAIFGAGSVGLAALLAARAADCAQIIVIDLNADRLAFATQLGATTTIDAGAEDAVARIRDLTGGGARFTLECTGVPAVLVQAVEALGVGGTCGVVGAAPFGATAAIDINHLLLGRSVRGIIEGDSDPGTFIPELITLWQAGRFPFDRLVRRYALGDANAAIDAMERGEVVKPVLVPNPQEQDA